MEGQDRNPPEPGPSSTEGSTLHRERRVGTSWSLLVATVFGIPIRIHFSFVLILLWVGYVAASRGESVPVALLLLLLLFACVVLHELGHATTALLFGVRTREIVLYPIGGIARLERLPSGMAELVIALAGPAVNLVIAGVLLFVAVAMGLSLQGMENMLGRNLILNLLVANLFIFFFNLLPAFPMDGGRVLRASLTLFMPEDRATHIAALVGQGMAILFGAAGLYLSQPFLVFIAFFVFLGAGQEALYQRRRTLIRGRTAREAMVTRFETLAPQETLGQATELLLATHQQDFPVVDAWGRVTGLLPRPVLMQGLAELGKSGAVLEVMLREFPTVSADAGLEEVVQKLQPDPTVPVLVLDDTRLVGMITAENLGELFDVFKRMEGRERRGTEPSEAG